MSLFFEKLQKLRCALLESNKTVLKFYAVIYQITKPEYTLNDQIKYKVNSNLILELIKNNNKLLLYTKRVVKGYFLVFSSMWVLHFLLI